MAQTRRAERRKATLIDGKAAITVTSRTVSLQLKREIREIEREHALRSSRETFELPDVLVSGSETARIEHLRDLRAQDPEKFDATIGAGFEAMDAGDLVILQIAQVVIDKNMISADSQRKKVEEPVIGEKGTVSDFWASQDIEVLEDFVESFRQRPEQG